jgi:3',5'-cyclic AMP phosphodiesterase CpdA
MSDATTVRLAQLSDIHIAAVARWHWRDWFSKRLTGWFHLRCLGRSRRFCHADAALTALVGELKGAHRPDHVIFSGDATALGFPEEVSRAAALLSMAELPPGLAVPGNHDYYTINDAAGGAFERAFAAWQTGERIGDATYPFAQRAGHLWLVALNSCTGNRVPWDAAGSVGPSQLERLRQLLDRLPPGPRVLVTHYPVGQQMGEPERRNHWLRDLPDVLRVADLGGIALWLHGHQHHAYCRVDPERLPFPVICAGSATQLGGGYNEYTVRGLELEGTRRNYDPVAGEFKSSGSFTLRLRG